MARGAGTLNSAETWGHWDDSVEGLAVTALKVTEAQALGPHRTISGTFGQPRREDLSIWVSLWQ